MLSSNLLVQYLGVKKQRTGVEGKVKLPSANNFNNFGGILSGPEDFEGSNSFKSLTMPEVLISIVEMSG